MDWNASSFEDCAFEGLLEDVWFRGGYPLPTDIDYFGRARPNEMRNVSFANAELRDVHFSDHCDLSSITLPLAGNYRLFSSWRPSLERLREFSRAWPPEDKAQAELFVESNMIHATNQRFYLLNYDDVKRDFGVELGTRILKGLVKGE